MVDIQGKNCTQVQEPSWLCYNSKIQRRLLVVKVVVLDMCGLPVDCDEGGEPSLIYIPKMRIFPCQ